jgi:hypothetical protein
MDKNSIHETNTVLWDERGIEVIGVTALPSLGAFILEENQAGKL